MKKTPYPKCVYIYIVTELQNTLDKTDTTKRREKSTSIVSNFNILYSVIYKTNRQKVQQGYRNTITHFDIVDIYRTFQLQ